MLFAALVVYIVLSFFILRLAPRFATTGRGKKWAIRIALFIILWYPAIEPAISYAVYKAYSYMYSGQEIYMTAKNVDRIFIETYYPASFHAPIQNRKTSDQKQTATMHYDAVEVVRQDGQIIEMLSNGTDQVIKQSKARYVIRWGKDIDTKYCAVYSTKIRNTNGDILAANRSVVWFGGGIMHLSFAGQRTYAECPESVDYKGFVYTVLRPAFTE